jgi:hypothetical protein
VQKLSHIRVDEILAGLALAPGLKLRLSAVNPKMTWSLKSVSLKELRSVASSAELEKISPQKLQNIPPCRLVRSVEGLVLSDCGRNGAKTQRSVRHPRGKLR